MQAPRLCLLAVSVVVNVVFTDRLSAQGVTTLVPSINGSGDVSIGPDGNIYVADFGVTLSNANGSTVSRVTPDGQVTVFATGLSGPSGNEFDSSGNLIQANIAGNRIDRIDPSGNVTTIASSGLVSPVGIAIADDGTIFAANCGGNSIVRIDNGSVVQIASGTPLSCPNGLTIDPGGVLYAANFNNGNVVRITQDGQMSVLASTPTSSFRPSGGNGHITYGNERLYVVGNASAQIFELLLDGTLTLIAGDGTRGHDDGPLLESSFSSPNGIALSADGRFLYINEAASTQGVVLSPPTFQLNPSLVRVIDLGEAPGPGFAINPGLNGAWFDPDTAGQGMLFDVIASTGTFFVAWFTYEAASGRRKIGVEEHRWLTAQGPFDSDTATLQLFVSEGGLFNDPATVTTTATGTASLTFSSCTEAVFDYALDEGLSGSIVLTRLTPDVFCSDLSGLSDMTGESP